MKKMISVLAMSLMLGACAGSGSSVSDMAAGVGSVLGGVMNGGTSTDSSTTSTTGTATGITAGLIKMYVQNQCVSNLQARNEWRLAALAMSAEKQAEWENKICGCVSEEAPNHITAADLTGALTEQGRAKLMTEVTAKTVTACYKRIFTGSLTGSK